jgi:hypothetical protein
MQTLVKNSILINEMQKSINTQITANISTHNESVCNNSLLGQTPTPTNTANNFSVTMLNQ